MTKPSRRPPQNDLQGALRDAAKDVASPEALPFRAAPHNLEAEQALLGAEVTSLDAVMDGLADFIDRHFAPGALNGLLT